MILGVIPARKGSKGIENKNTYHLCGKQLIEYTVEAAKKSKLDSVLITTDDIAILNEYGGINRPSDLCQDGILMNPVIQHAVKEFEKSIGMLVVDAVMVLQPTSPLRTTEDINKAIDVFNQNDRLSLYSGYYMGIKQKHKVYDKHTQSHTFSEMVLFLFLNGAY
jgi:CMP-N-acetylneuraminic acid synthetase